MKPKLTEQDFIRAANRLKCEVNAVKAVAQVESAGAGFYSDGFPVILFERHIFRRETGGKYSTTHPSLSGAQGNYGPAGRNQRLKFSKAFALDPEAAMKACSWGKFQILGVNHKICGFSEVGDFVEAMKESEGRQLDAFVSFVAGNKLDKYLREKNWAAFAKGYNGPGYAKNKYDIKMRDAYAKFEREAPTTSAARPTVDPVEPAKNKEGLSESPQPPIQNEVHIENAEQVKIDAPKPQPSGETVAVKDQKTSIWAKIGAGFAVLTGAGINWWSVIEGKLNALEPLHFLYVILALGLIAIALYLYDRAGKRAHERTQQLIDVAADPAKNTVEVAK